MHWHQWHDIHVNINTVLLWPAAVMWLQGIIVKCLLAVAVLGSLGFAYNGRVEELRLTREHPLVKHIPGQRVPVTPLDHTTMEEIVKELNNMGVRCICMYNDSRLSAIRYSYIYLIARLIRLSTIRYSYNTSLISSNLRYPTSY